MKLIDRHIYGEIVPMFLFGVIAFTTLILGGGVFYQMIRFAIEYNVNFLLVMQIFLLKLPEIIAYTLPMSSLFCVLLGFNKLSSELEVTAMRSAGVSFYRMTAPVLIFGLMVSVLTLVLNDKISPISNSRFNYLEKKIKDQAMNNLDEKSITWENRKNGVVDSILYARETKGTKLLDLCYTEMKEGKIIRKTLAKEADFKRTHWRLKDGYQLNFEGAVDPKIIVKFIEMDIVFDQGMEDIAMEKTKAGNYTYSELKQRIKLLAKQGSSTADLRKLQVDFYSKLSIPFASFAFVLIAAPLGLKPQRTSSSVGLGYSVILIFAYYIIQQMFRALGQSFVNPFAAAWIPNIILCFVGAWLVYRASE